MAPSVLIPLAERAGLISDIGRWALQEASAQQGRWQHDHQVDDMSISVNVSAHQLMSGRFCRHRRRRPLDSHCRSDQLTLEMTESVFVTDGERALVVLNDLKALGVRIALDDFGTGYSSLSYLLQFPVDIVKIDKIFVAGLGRDRPNQAIIAAVIQLAHDLGLTVVAEGVETVERHREWPASVLTYARASTSPRPMSPVWTSTRLSNSTFGASQSLPKLAAL